MSSSTPGKCIRKQAVETTWSIPEIIVPAWSLLQLLVLPFIPAQASLHGGLWLGCDRKSPLTSELPLGRTFITMESTLGHTPKQHFLGGDSNTYFQSN